MKTYAQYPPHRLQSGSCSGALTLTGYQRFQCLRDALQKEGFSIPPPTGN